MTSPSRRLLVSASLFALIAHQSAALAASGTWTNTAGGLWSTPANWQSNNIANGTDALADFSTLNISTTTTVKLDTPRTIGSLKFGDLTPSANWILNNNSNNTNTLTLATSTGTPTITVVNDAATISAAIAGTQGLSIVGPGTLTLSGANTYTGNTTINANASLIAAWQGGGTFGAIPANNTIVNSGALTLERDSSDTNFMAVITGSGATTITGNGGYLNLGSPGDGIARLSNQSDLTVNIGLNLFKNAQTIGALNGNGIITSNTGGAAASVTLTVGNNNHNGTFSGVIDNNGSEAIQLTKIGTGTQILTGIDTYAGGTSVSRGCLQLGDGSVVDGSIVGSINISGAGLLVVANPTAETLSGDISGTGNLTKIGAGNLTLTGSNSGYSGRMFVNDGTLTIADTTFADAVNVGTSGIAGQNASLVVPAGSALHQTIDQFTVGASSGSTGNLTVAGTLALITLNVNNTGTATLSGNTSIHGGLFINGGSLTTGSGLSIVNAAPLVENGGSWTAASGFEDPPGSNLTVTGQNSLFHVLGTLSIIGGSQYTISSGGSLIADGAITVPDSGNISVTGAGSSLSATALTFNSGGNLTVSTGASLSLSSPANSLILTPNVAFSINGGSVSIPDFPFVGSSVSFISGSLSTSDSLQFTTSGIELHGSTNTGFITSDTTLSNRSLSTTAPAAIDPAVTLTISGGSLTAATLTGGGALSFINGSLSITNGNFAIGSALVPPLLTINAGSSISVAGSTTLTSSSVLTLLGAFSSGSVVNAGILDVSNTANLSILGSLTNNGTLILDPANAPAIGGAIINNHIMEAGTSISGANSLANNGTLTVDGTLDIAKTAGLMNNSTGAVVLSTGTLLHFTSARFTNSGLVSLDSGSIAGSGANSTLTNNSTGLIRGPGAISIPVTNAGSISSGPGTLTFSASLTNAGSIDTGAGNISTTTSFTSNGTVHALANGAFTSSGSAQNNNLMTGDPNSTFNFTSSSFINNGTFTNAGALQASAITNNGNFTQSGPQTWSFAATFTNTGNATFQSNAKLSNLTITAGTVDITSSKFIIETTTNKPATLAALQSEIANRSLIASGMPANFALALLDNASLNLTTFGGLPVDTNSLLLSEELLGDANIDGHVDLTDLSTILNNFGTTTSAWTSGNFDRTPTIDLTDLSAVLNNFGLTNPNATALSFNLYPSSLTTPTPEPASLALLALAAPLLLRRRQRALKINAT